MSRTGDAAAWSAVDAFTVEALHGDDPAARRALERSAREGLPDIAVSAAQGRLLQLLARMSGARRILEVGTLGGYSTLWLAKALPAGGRLVTLERDAHHAATARANLADAGLVETVDVRLGAAADSLGHLASEGGEPFDFVFIDADKASYPLYLRLVLPLLARGGVIAADNVVRRGGVLHPEGDANAAGARAFIQAVGREPRVSATVVQTVGEKGWDGLLIALADA